MHIGSTTRPLAIGAFVLCACAWNTCAQELQRGAIVDPVQCAGDASQTYALFLPSNYSPERQWSVVLAFHPGARGRLMVEKFQRGAERHGYIVAGSNNSRNGPYAISAAAAQAMTADVSRRFSIDPKRVYVTGFSGGARVSLGLALANKNIAGVIASSGGYPDSRARSDAPFAIFSTAGTEDFNYLEMRMLDRKLASPHFLAVFQGGHTLPPDDVAADALEWMQLQAMQSRRRSRDAALVGEMLEKRRAKIAASSDLAETVYLMQALVADFNGLADVAVDASRLEQLSSQPDVKKALKRERDADDHEFRALREIFELETRLGDEVRRDGALMNLRERLDKLSRAAAGEADTPERRQARRMLRSVTFGASGRVQDREYLMLLERFGRRG